MQSQTSCDKSSQVNESEYQDRCSVHQILKNSNLNADGVAINVKNPFLPNNDNASDEPSFLANTAGNLSINTLTVSGKPVPRKPSIDTPRSRSVAILERLRKSLCEASNIDLKMFKPTALMQSETEFLIKHLDDSS